MIKKVLYPDDEYTMRCKVRHMVEGDTNKQVECQTVDGPEEVPYVKRVIDFMCGPNCTDIDLLLLDMGLDRRYAMNDKSIHPMSGCLVYKAMEAVSLVVHGQSMAPTVALTKLSAADWLPFVFPRGINRGWVMKNDLDTRWSLVQAIYNFTSDSMLFSPTAKADFLDLLTDSWLYGHLRSIIQDSKEDFVEGDTDSVVATLRNEDPSELTINARTALARSFSKDAECPGHARHYRMTLSRTETFLFVSLKQGLTIPNVAELRGVEKSSVNTEFKNLKNKCIESIGEDCKITVTNNDRGENTERFTQVAVVEALKKGQESCKVLVPQTFEIDAIGQIEVWKQRTSLQGTDVTHREIRPRSKVAVDSPQNESPTYAALRQAGNLPAEVTWNRDGSRETLRVTGLLHKSTPVNLLIDFLNHRFRVCNGMGDIIIDYPDDMLTSFLFYPHKDGNVHIERIGAYPRDEPLGLDFNII